MDRKDPVCGMEGIHRAHGKWFCSFSCLRKYEKMNKLQMSPCDSCGLHGARWYKERFWITLILAGIVLTAAFYFEFLNPVYVAFVDYFNMVWWAVLLGLLIGGLIDRFVPAAYISKLLARKKKSTILNAVCMGFLMSACSHGILAIAMQLYRKGASVPAVIAFLMASPWANISITILLFGFFGTKALYIIFGAILIALITGLIFQILDSKGMIEKSPHTRHEVNYSIIKDIKVRAKNYRFDFEKDIGAVLQAMWNLNKMVTWWIIIGMMIASFARAFVPQHFFMAYMGATIGGILVTLGLAAIIEVCSEGSSPMAFEIFRQTGAFGNSTVFLMAGVALDYTEIGLIWSNIGRKAAIWMPIIAVPQIILLGWLLNTLL